MNKINETQLGCPIQTKQNHKWLNDQEIVKTQLRITDYG